MNEIKDYSEFKMLNEMAYERNRALEKVEDLMPQIVEHLLKILITENEVEINLNHWSSEIENWLKLINRFSRLKNNTRLKYRDYVDNLWVHFSEKDILIDISSMSYNYIFADYDMNELREVIFEFFDLVFTKMSQDKFNELKIKELLKDLYKKREIIIIDT